MPGSLPILGTVKIRFLVDGTKDAPIILCDKENPKCTTILIKLQMRGREEVEKVSVSCSVMSDSATPWTVAHQAPLSMGFSRQEYWSG